MKKTIVLFDMDGTLTEPRKPFNSKKLKDALYQLSNYNTDIGIITGSDEDYLREQMGDFLSHSSCRYKLHLLPCNGTKYLKPPMFPSNDFELVHEVSMSKHLGDKIYRELIYELILSQVDMANSGVPLTGHFINCRGSTINWSPIGRNANSEQREEFIKIDKTSNLRTRVLDELKAMLKQKDLLRHLTIKIGGDTSFDIYPVGWDKTYGLKHFEGWNVWFVGDRCCKDGNDFEIFNACRDQSYITTGPEHTFQIVREIYLKIKNLEVHDE